jgi:hypothetical protein
MMISSVPRGCKVIIGFLKIDRNSPGLGTSSRSHNSIFRWSGDSEGRRSIGVKAFTVDGNTVQHFPTKNTRPQNATSRYKFQGRTHVVRKMDRKEAFVIRLMENGRTRSSYPEGSFLQGMKSLQTRKNLIPASTTTTRAKGITVIVR